MDVENKWKKLEEGLASLKASVASDLREAQVAAASQSWDDLSPLAFSDGVYGLAHQDPSHHLHPLAKWPKIRSAPLSTTMSDMLAVATYPHRPEQARIPLDRTERGHQVSYSIVARWQTGRLTRRDDANKVPEERDESDEFDIMHAEDENDENMVRMRKGALNRTAANLANLWSAESLADLDASIERSQAFEAQHAAFFVPRDNQDRSYFESILPFAKLVSVLSEPNISDAILRQPLASPPSTTLTKPSTSVYEKSHVVHDFDRHASFEILTREDFDQQ